MLLLFLFLWQLCCDALLITPHCALNHNDERLTRLSELPCPSRPACQCYVGAVDCSGGNLTRLPSNLTRTTALLLNNNSFTRFPKFADMYPDWSNNISILDLSHNKIDYFLFRSIERLNSLQYIDLRYNEISHLGRRIFGLSITLQAPGCFLLGHNSLDYIFYRNFPKAIQTQFIDFSFNKIPTLSRNNFEVFTFFQISLRGNKLKKLDLNYFYINQQMQKLDVSNNLMVNISNEDAIHLSSLKSLNLSHNNITNIFPNIISQLPTLEVLDLSFNRLSDFAFLTSLSNLSLRIYAEGNPWKCNCNSSTLYQQLSGKHIFACRNGGDECLYCATPANLTGVLIQNTCSEPKSTVPTNTKPIVTHSTNTENSNLITILLIISGTFATTLLVAGFSWKIRQRKLKKDSIIKPKLKHSNQQKQLANNNADTTYDSTALNSFKASLPQQSQIPSLNQPYSTAPHQRKFLQVHDEMGAPNNQKAYQRSHDSREIEGSYMNEINSKEIDGIYMNQINSGEIDGIYMNNIHLQQKSKLSACDDERNYVNIDMTSHQVQIQSRSGNQEHNKSNSNRVHSSLHKAEITL